ncbi:MAG: hypothetical protein IPN40_16210 [Uliginosibacterium sp.]|nr:hypothetical protein [Uliginosibacterium sp.]
MSADENRALPETGPRVAAMYALVAHRLSTYYDHGHWLTRAQAAALCAEWLQRSRLVLSRVEREQLADLSDTIALQVRGLVARGGPGAAHELMESLDPRHVSDSVRR